MNNNKMKFQTPDLTAEAKAKLAELFPGAVAEGKVNIDLLRAILGEDVFADEAYEFTWVGKRAAIAEAGYATICEIGKERIRRAGDKIKSEAGLTVQGLDVGFRVLKLADTNMNDVYYAAGEYTQDLVAMMEGNIKPDRTNMDLLFGCLLDWGLPLSMPHTHEKIEDPSRAGSFTVHTYNGGDLIACFEEKVPESVVREIAGRKPLRAVFRDSGFESSPQKINVFEIFKLLAPNTNVRVI